MARLINPLLRAQTFTQRKGVDAGNRALRRDVQRLKSRLVTPPDSQDVPDDWTVVETVDELPDPDTRHIGRLLHVRSDGKPDAFNIGIQQPDDTVTWAPLNIDSGAKSAGWQFVRAFNASDSGLGLLGAPNDVAIAPTGEIWVIDSGNARLWKFSAAGAFIARFGSAGSGNGQFASPNGVAIDASGNIFVADTGNRRIQKFTSAGVYTTQWGALGSGSGQFNLPTGIAVDASGNVYVADTNNNRIQKFSNAGVYTTQWGTLGSGNGQFKAPQSIDIDGAGNVYVGDAQNYRVQKFDVVGNYLGQWGGHGNAPGQLSQPLGLAVDASGNVYVSESNNNRIQVFDSNGNTLAILGSYGSAGGQFIVPAGLAVDANGTIYATDINNHRVHIWVMPSLRPNYTISTNATTVSNGNASTITANCDAGEVAVGGGASITGGANVWIQESKPNVGSGTPTGWTATGRNSLASGGAPMTVYVICLS